MSELVLGLVAAVKAAEARLRGRVKKTELRRSQALSEQFGQPIYLKLECQQQTGSFKFRPALNSVLAAQELGLPGDGFITSSSGNFGIAAAQACQQEGQRLLLVMMPSASNYKAEIAASLGAEIILCRDDYAAREELVQELCRDRGLQALHPHDSLATVAGDATIAQEIVAQLPGEIGSVLVPTSGGGLLAGLAIGLEMAGRHAEIYAVQPAANASMARSLAVGKRLRTERVETMADGLTAAVPGAIGFRVAQSHVRDVALVAETAIPAAMRRLWETEAILVEPASALPLAALMTGMIQPRAPVVLILTGANVAQERWNELTAS